ncbi:MAG: YncE family protein [Acidimicrobiales bacterium]
MHLSVFRGAPVRKTGAFAALLVLAGAGVSACSGTSNAAKARTRHRPASVVSKVLPAPKDLLAASSPQPNGTVWVLSGTPVVRTLTDIDLSDGKELTQVGVSNSASSVAESPTGVLALGLATRATGAVELLNATSGAVEGSVAVGAPVRAVAFGSDGVTLYVLNGNAASTSVATVNTTTDKVVASFGVAKDAISLAPDPSQSAVWTLDRSGVVEEISLSSGKPVADFSLGNPGISVAASPAGGTIYVLKGTPAGSNIAVVSTVTDSVKELLAAAAGSVALAVSPTGQVLYDFVGTPTVGNVQVMSLGQGNT